MAQEVNGILKIVLYIEKKGSHLGIPYILIFYTILKEASRLCLLYLTICLVETVTVGTCKWAQRVCNSLHNKGRTLCYKDQTCKKETEENKTPSTFRHCIKKLKLNLGLPARSCVIQRWEWQVVASGVSPSYPKACDAICKQLQHLNQMLGER